MCFTSAFSNCVHNVTRLELNWKIYQILVSAEKQNEHKKIIQKIMFKIKKEKHSIFGTYQKQEGKKIIICILKYRAQHKSHTRIISRNDKNTQTFPCILRENCNVSERIFQLIFLSWYTRGDLFLWEFWVLKSCSYTRVHTLLKISNSIFTAFLQASSE